MVQLHWGHKRTCQGCQARFYDMRRNPITCPHCQAVFEPYASSRGRRRHDPLKDMAIVPIEADFNDSMADDSLDDSDASEGLEDDDLFQENGN